MKRPDVEVFAQLYLGTGPYLQDFKLTNLVGQRLARPGNVAVDLVYDVVLGLGRIVLEEVDRLLPCPALVVHASVDDEAHSTPHVIG
jgi:hypothetical protein